MTISRFKKSYSGHKKDFTDNDKSGVLGWLGDKLKRKPEEEDEPKPAKATDEDDAEQLAKDLDGNRPAKFMRNIREGHATVEA